MLLFALWVGLSGLIEGLFLVAGAVSSVIVVLITERMYHPAVADRFGRAPSSFVWLAATWGRFVSYVPLLLWQVLLANLHVARLVLDPRLPIDPALVEFESPLTTEAAHAVLANSITLTPGTVTVEAAHHRFVVHCISAGSRRGMEEGALLRSVGWVFGERGAPVPPVREIAGLEEMGEGARE